ncbi:hypothetical protein CLV24_11725 [Pontibacter ummariensis]|uniref:Thiol-activated cytolysin n=1 Tax=Pontibacter ummariensis TaxID=1610492 RepID=A0A239IFB6_9BACT|nr:hypothetical protein [Pontibacter ummariensis]PRY09821.1 hypothetical protein CLV24_11725 [Pontibacter ummariensis]SNS92229.1 hypothetical protein SAMN06296052_11725 [Pontibacter ummariensis]
MKHSLITGISSFALMLWASSCNTLNPFSQEKLTSYHKKIKDVHAQETLDDAKKYVEITSTYAKPIQAASEKEPAKNVFDLHPEGQEKLLEVLGKEYKGKPEDFLKKIAVPIVYSPSSTVEGIKDKSEVQVKLLLDISDNKNNDITANRISEIKVRMKLVNDNFQFVKFNNIQTKYDIVDFGKITNENARNFSLNAGANVSFGTTGTSYNDSGLSTGGSTSTTTPTVGGSYSLSNKTNEEVTLSKRILSQTGALTNRFGFIYLQGSPTNNLEGPLNIELTVKAKENVEHEFAKVSPLFKGTQPVDPKLVNTEFVFHAIPVLGKDSVLSVEVLYDYVYREVKRNSQTVTESDDVIFYNIGKPNKGTYHTLIRQADLPNKGYTIVDTDSNKYLKIEDRPAKGRQSQIVKRLLFETREEAALFLRWFNLLRPDSIHNKRLMLGNGFLGSASSNVSLRISEEILAY